MSAPMRLKYDVKKVFVDGRDVCLSYDPNISGTNVFGYTRYQVEDRRIHSLRVALDPRPVLESGIDKTLGSTQTSS